EPGQRVSGAVVWRGAWVARSSRKRRGRTRGDGGWGITRFRLVVTRRWGFAKVAAMSALTGRSQLTGLLSCSLVLLLLSSTSAAIGAAPAETGSYELHPALQMS